MHDGERDRVPLAARVGRFVDDPPLAAAAIAFGLGSAPGGGPLSRATLRLGALGLRLGGLSLARRVFPTTA